MAFPLKVVRQAHLGPYNAAFFRPFNSSLVFWGVGAGTAVSLFMSSVPLFQKDVLDHIPFVRKYFVDNTPDSDKPF